MTAVLQSGRAACPPLKRHHVPARPPVPPHRQARANFRVTAPSGAVTRYGAPDPAHPGRRHPRRRQPDGACDRHQSRAGRSRSLYGRTAGDRGRRHPLACSISSPSTCAGTATTRCASRCGGRRGSRAGWGSSTRPTGRSATSPTTMISTTASTICSSMPTASIRAPISPIRTMSLDAAQEAKLAHIAAKLDLKPGQRVLDIGCGWGGMARYIHKVSGADVTGVTLSEEQLKYAQGQAAADGVADTCPLRTDRLSRAARPPAPGASTASFRSACSNMSGCRTTASFSIPSTPC